MRTALAALTFLLFLTGNAAMAAYIVKTTTDVNLRAGKSTDSQAIAIVRSGKQLTVLEDGDIWLKVSTDEGKQGWINRKFVTKSKNASESKSETKSEPKPEGKNSAHEETMGELQGETLTPPPQKDLPAEDVKAGGHETLTPEQQIHALKTQLDDANMQLEAIKKDTADCAKIKPEYEKARAEIENLNKTIDEMDKKIVAKGVRWFLAGAAVLLLGWFLGMNTRSKNRYY